MFFFFAALVFFLVVVLVVVVFVMVGLRFLLVFFLVMVGLRFFLVFFLVVVVFVRVGFWFPGGVVFGGVFGFGFFPGLALFFDVGAFFAEFLEFFGFGGAGEAVCEEIADGGFDLFFDAAVFVGERAVRIFGTSFGDAFEGFGGVGRGGVWGGLVAEGIELIAEGHELVLEGFELLVDVGVRPGGGGHAVGVRDGGGRLGLLRAEVGARALVGAEGADELAEFHGFIGMAFGFLGAGDLFDAGDGARGDGWGGLWGVGAAALLGAVGLVWGAFARAGELRRVRWLGGVLGEEGGGGEEGGEEREEGGFHGWDGWVGRVGPRDGCDHGRSVGVSGAWSRVCVGGEVGGHEKASGKRVPGGF
ncbi:MAG: hypothetical protein DVB22_003216 [Verrucomicrobia bacterium]|nr:MAG: hypothetical protein DVB22_003216 [Verrucomicrobiota bacterium]